MRFVLTSVAAKSVNALVGVCRLVIVRRGMMESEGGVPDAYKLTGSYCGEPFHKLPKAGVVIASVRQQTT